MALIWHLSVVRNSKFTLVSGVILDIEKTDKKKTKNNISVPGSYLKNTYANREVHLKVKNNNFPIKTDRYGEFYIKIEEHSSAPIQVFDDAKNEISTRQEYPIEFEQKQTGPLVISDIDDTIMRSFTKTRIKRLITTLFKKASKRKVISYTQQLYKNIGSEADFFYVSKSENNLFHLISRFILHNELPLGPLLLTPYLNASQLILEKKNVNFKSENICNILDHCGNKRVILIGDDTQSDMKIYCDIVNIYKKRVEKVYIRQTRPRVSKDQLQQWEKLKETGVSASYFKHDEILTPNNQL